MSNLIQKILYWFLSVQEKILSKRLSKHLKTNFSNSTSKTVITKDDTLKLTAKTELLKEKLQKNVAEIIKNLNYDTENMLSYIEEKGTLVVRNSNAKTVLNFLREEEGLIRSLKGFPAFLLNLLLRSKISFKTTPMFVLGVGQVDKYYMIHQFYKWYAMKINLPGFDTEAQENFKKFAMLDSQDIKSLNLEEIIALKEAIARDIEAVDFVEKIVKSVDGSKNALKKLSDGGASI